MTTKIVYVALMSGSLVPMDKVARVEERKDGCVVSIYDGWWLKCAGRTFAESLRILEIYDDRIGRMGEEAEQ